MFVPFVQGRLQVQQVVNWPSMTSNHVLSIRLYCWEITQGIEKSYEIPGITTAHMSQSNYFVYVCSTSPPPPPSDSVHFLRLTPYYF